MISTNDPLAALRALAATVHTEDFPFEEIRTETGDYFGAIGAAELRGYSKDQIWSVTEENNEWCYGPPHHWVNLIGYVATEERHDHNTYYIQKEYDHA